VQLFEEFQRDEMEYRKPNERIYSLLNRPGHSEYEQTRRIDFIAVLRPPEGLKSLITQNETSET
jgi:hypothetical protein